MKTLFPEMDAEIREDRMASKREKVQRARDYLKDRDLNWLINRILEQGPQTEHNLIMDAMDEDFFAKDFSKRLCDILCDLHALWVVKKLWRLRLGIHPGSGEALHLWGIRGVHEQPGKRGARE